MAEALAQLDLGLLVVPAELRAVAAAHRVASDVGMVLRDLRWWSAGPYARRAGRAGVAAAAAGCRSPANCPGSRACWRPQDGGAPPGAARAGRWPGSARPSGSGRWPGERRERPSGRGSERCRATAGVEPAAASVGAETLLDAVRQRLAESGAEPTPGAGGGRAAGAGAAARGRAKCSGAAEALRSRAGGHGPAGAAARRPVGHRRAGVRARPGVGGPGPRAGAAPTCAFPDAAVGAHGSRSGWRRSAGRRLDDARPWVDARLPDGTRLHAVLPPVAVGSTCLSLRVVRPRAFTLDELVAAGTVPPGGDRVLRALLDARLSFLISGGTGSGKTTLAERACWGWSGRAERIVLAEDSAELRPDHPACGAAGGASGEPGGRGPGRPCGTWCGRRCGCGRTGWWSARCEGPR